MRVLLFTIALAVALAGCGHKGPLYLSKDKPQAQKPPTPVLPDERERPGEIAR